MNECEVCGFVFADLVDISIDGSHWRVCSGCHMEADEYVSQMDGRGRQAGVEYCENCGSGFGEEGGQCVVCQESVGFLGRDGAA